MSTGYSPRWMAGGGGEAGSRFQSGVNASAIGCAPSCGMGEQQAGHGIPAPPQWHAPCSQSTRMRHARRNGPR
jgi:hypothetical protein